MIREGVAYAKAYCDDVEFSAEDATRSDRKFLAKAFSVAVKAGATVLNVADTVGYTTPAEMASLIAYLKKHVEGIDEVELSVHCHNDLGLATANTLAAVLAGRAAGGVHRQRHRRARGQRGARGGRHVAAHTPRCLSA